MKTLVFRFFLNCLHFGPVVRFRFCVFRIMMLYTLRVLPKCFNLLNVCWFIRRWSVASCLVLNEGQYLQAFWSFALEGFVSSIEDLKFTGNHFGA